MQRPVFALAAAFLRHRSVLPCGTAREPGPYRIARIIISEALPGNLKIGGYFNGGRTDEFGSSSGEEKKRPMPGRQKESEGKKSQSHKIE